ncbi:MAG: HAMP domain-containing histidine kinase [Proteobacteria bacterium]|nr:HAMP domain-containing histidine kinase [Pseudomonadota bacterium]
MQTISEQSTVEDVARTALAWAVELTGSLCGLLAFTHDGALRCVVELNAETGRVVLRTTTSLVDVAPQPAALIERVLRSRCEEIVETGHFDLESGGGNTEPGSAGAGRGTAVGLPILCRGQLSGVLYLEIDSRDIETPALLDVNSGLHSLPVHLASGLALARLIAAQTAIVSAHLAERAALLERLAERQQQLEAADARGQAASQELDDIAHWVAHDLRTPLTSVMGFTQILLADWAELPASEIDSLLGTIDQSSMKMAQILDELLVIVRLRKGGVERTALDMEEIVAQAQLRLANAIRRCEGRIETAASWPAAAGYRPWIEAVWSTLIRSGLDHGGRPPSLTLGATEQGDGLIGFWLRDNGPGLSDDTRAQLFAPLQYSGGTHNQGHGFGFALARQIVEALGGELSIESVPGQGNTYYFTLPAVEPTGYRVSFPGSR